MTLKLGSLIAFQAGSASGDNSDRSDTCRKSLNSEAGKDATNASKTKYSPFCCPQLQACLTLGTYFRTQLQNENIRRAARSINLTFDKTVWGWMKLGRALSHSDCPP